MFSRKIAVIDRHILEDFGVLKHGFSPLSDLSKTKLFQDRKVTSWDLLKDLNSHLRWVERGPAESDPSMKQLIPYVLVRQKSAFFTTERLQAGSEARLHGKLSIGIGGHLEENDRSAKIITGMLRELHEELRFFTSIPQPECIGLINDDTNAVGSVHLGIVFICDLIQEINVEVRETTKLRGQFQPNFWLRSQENRLETWSLLLLDHFYK